MWLKNKVLAKTIHILLGIALIFFGLNMLFQFFAAGEFNEAATAYLSALFAAGYIFPILGILMILAGIAFIFKKGAPLGAIILFPITLNFVLFHIFLDATGWIGAVVIFILNIYIIYIHFDSYKPFCKN